MTAIIYASPSEAAAQISGDLEVRVFDASKLPVSGASVTARSKDTGVTRSARSDANGAVMFRQLAIGAYEIRTESPAFTSSVTGAIVNSGATTSVPIALQIRTSEQQIIVSDRSPSLNITNAQLQVSLESAKVANLPLGIVSGPLALGGGVLLSLATISPGILPTLPKSHRMNPGTFATNGGRGRGNNITLDNATATDVVTSGGMGLQTVPIDAVKEFNVITNNLNAEFGRNSGAQIQILTKSGTNEFHGSLFEFFRNSALNTRDYFDRSGRATPLRSNDWGAAAGGPLRRNRVFFFGHYEQIRTRGEADTRVANVPRPEQVSGRVDPTAAELLKRLLVPIHPSGTVSNPAPQAADFHGLSARTDINLTGRDVIYARYGFADYLFRSPASTFGTYSNLPTTGTAVANSPTNASVSHTHTFGTSAVNQILVSFGRSIPTFPPLFNLESPSIRFRDGTSDFGWMPAVRSMRLQNTFQYLDSLTYNRGAHQWKFGTDLSRIQSNTFIDTFQRGVFVFLSLPDYLAGRPNSYTQRFGNSYRGFRVWNNAFFVQDDFRVSRHLTLNLGLRLERALDITEVNGLLSNLNLNSRVSLGAAGSGPLGAFDVGGSATATNWNWAPRLGFAWNPNGDKLSIRGGYGITYDFLYLNLITQLRALPPLMYQFALSSTEFTGGNTFASLVAGTSDFQRVGNAAVGTFPQSIRNFGEITPVDQRLRNPQVQQWSLTAERELPFGLTGRVSYVGTKSNYLQRQRPINLLPSGRFSAPRTPEEEQSLQQAGIFMTVDRGLKAGLTTPGNRLDSRFNGVSYLDSSANSNYHSAQFYLTRRFAAGYGISLSYTFSKSIDDVSDAFSAFQNDSEFQQNPWNNRDNRGVSAFDVPHRLVITHIFEPRLLPGLHNSALRSIAHGWQFQGTFQAQSGLPVTLLAGPRLGLDDPLLIGGGGAQRPHVTGPVHLSFDANPGLNERNPNKTAASGLTQPLVGHFGTLGRNTMRINSFIQADWAVGKSFAMTEKIRAQVQAQFYNLFNNTTFSSPGRVLATHRLSATIATQIASPGK